MRPRPTRTLVLHGVRGVIGGDDVDDAVGQGLPDRLHVALAAKGRVHLVDRVVGGSQVMGEQQVVRSDFRGHCDAAALGPPENLHRAGRRDVTDVQA